MGDWRGNIPENRAFNLDSAVEKTYTRMRSTAVSKIMKTSSKVHTIKQLKNTSRILMISTRRIGDVLLATPLIRSLRLALPQAKIDVLVFESSVGVLAANPDINQVLVVSERPD